MNRLPVGIKNALVQLVGENDFIDGFAIGGSVAKGLVDGNDVDVDLLCPSRGSISAQIERFKPISKTPYSTFIETLCKRFHEILHEGPVLHIRKAIRRGLISGTEYRSTTIYVFRNEVIARLWKVFGDQEIYFQEKEE